MRKRVIITISVSEETPKELFSSCVEGMDIALEAIRQRMDSGMIFSAGSTSTGNDSGSVSVDINYKER